MPSVSTDPTGAPPYPNVFAGVLSGAKGVDIDPVTGIFAEATLREIIRYGSGPLPGSGSYDVQQTIISGWVLASSTTLSTPEQGNFRQAWQDALDNWPTLNWNSWMIAGDKPSWVPDSVDFGDGFSAFPEVGITMSTDASTVVEDLTNRATAVAYTEQIARGYANDPAYESEFPPWAWIHMVAGDAFVFPHLDNLEAYLSNLIDNIFTDVSGYAP